jgi:phosphopantothenoylcysteine decarboxylase / phosphopantothenate---cysteine ligase
MHPSEEIRGLKSSFLKDKRIVLAVTGSIAAVETIRLARELIRHGARVIPVMTPAATRIIHPDALWFATGNRPIVELSGDTEHVRFCGRVKDSVDLLLIAPSTANTISKIALGIDDTAVTTFATTAIGSHLPIIIVPAMHLAMYDHDGVQGHVSTLTEQGIEFIGPYFKGSKAKIASNEDIVARVLHRIGPGRLDGKKILVIGGSTQEPIDDVRCLTNKSSGKTAVSFASTAFFYGGNVSLWYGQSNEPVPLFLSVSRFKSISDVKELIRKTHVGSFDIIIVCAALADFIPDRKQGKIDSSEENFSIQCNQAEKIIPLLRKKAPESKIIGFKLAETKQIAIAKAQQLGSIDKLDAVVANTVSSLEQDHQQAWIVDSSGNIEEISGSKQKVSCHILSFIATVIS